MQSGNSTPKRNKNKPEKSRFHELPPFEQLTFTDAYVQGFSDGESCLNISFSYRNKFRTKLEVRASFSVSQKSHSVDVIQSLIKFFDGGFVRYSRRDDTYKYETRDRAHISARIIPFFKKNPLLTQKRKDFELFVQCVEIMQKNEHLTFDGMRKIIDLAVQMNPSGRRKYNREALLKILNAAEAGNTSVVNKLAADLDLNENSDSDSDSVLVQGKP